jgi:hypothetical protein
MQTMVAGFGSGGRNCTPVSGTPSPVAAASIFPRYAAKRSIRPQIRLCGPVCGISRTAALTSTIRSPFTTPSLKSSKYASFMCGSSRCSGQQLNNIQCPVEATPAAALM